MVLVPPREQERHAERPQPSELCVRLRGPCESRNMGQVMGRWLYCEYACVSRRGSGNGSTNWPGYGVVCCVYACAVGVGRVLSQVMGRGYMGWVYYGLRHGAELWPVYWVGLYCPYACATRVGRVMSQVTGRFEGRVMTGVRVELYCVHVCAVGVGRVIMDWVIIRFMSRVIGRLILCLR